MPGIKKFKVTSLDKPRKGRDKDTQAKLDKLPKLELSFYRNLAATLKEENKVLKRELLWSEITIIIMLVLAVIVGATIR
jgi:hypothetical protein